MQSRVTEILDNVHQMSITKRYLIGGIILLVIVAVVIAFVILIK